MAVDVWQTRRTGLERIADHPMREWTVEPIVYEVMLTKNAYEEQSRALLPTVRRSPTRGSSLTPLPGVASDAVGFRRQAY